MTCFSIGYFSCSPLKDMCSRSGCKALDQKFCSEILTSLSLPFRLCCQTDIMRPQCGLTLAVGPNSGLRKSRGALPNQSSVGVYYQNDTTKQSVWYSVREFAVSELSKNSEVVLTLAHTKAIFLEFQIHWPNSGRVCSETRMIFIF